MADYATLKSAIQQAIKANGNNEITGPLLQQTLLAMINTMATGAQFMGAAVPSTNPGTPDYDVAYIAGEPGTYSYFGGLNLTYGEIALFYYDSSAGSWITTVMSGIRFTRNGAVVQLIDANGNDMYPITLTTAVYTDTTKTKTLADILDKPTGLVIPFENTDVVAGFYDTSGNIQPSSASVRDNRYFVVYPNQKLYFVFTTAYRIQVVFYNKDKSVLSVQEWTTNGEITTPAGCNYIRVCFNVAGGVTPSTFQTVFMSIIPSSAGLNENYALTPDGWRNDFAKTSQVTPALLATGYTKVLGVLRESNGYIDYSGNTRVITSWIPAASCARVVVSSNSWYVRVAFFDANYKYLGRTDDNAGGIVPGQFPGTAYIRVLFVKGGLAVIDPSEISSIGEQIYINVGPVDKRFAIATTPMFEQGGYYANGVPVSRNDRIRTGLIPINSICHCGVQNGFTLGYLIFDKNRNFVSMTGPVTAPEFFDAHTDGFVAFIIGRSSGQNIAPTDLAETGFSIEYLPLFAEQSPDYRLIKLAAIAPTYTPDVSELGCIYYNTSTKLLRHFYTSTNNVPEWETVPFVDGAIYTYNSELYLWNGVDLINITAELKDAIKQLQDTIKMTESALTLSAFVALGNYYIYPSGGSYAEGSLLESSAWRAYKLVLENVVKSGVFTLNSDNANADAIAFYSDSETLDGTTFISGIRIRAEVGGQYAIDVNSIPANCKCIAICNKATVGDPSVNLDVLFSDTLKDFENRITDLENDPAIPAGGQPGDVLTPDGWNGNYPQRSETVTLSALAALLADYVQFTDDVYNISNGAVTVPTLSQAVLDLINTAGGGTIVNMPDDIDIETNAQNRLQLKGGGVVRFRVQSTAADNYTELVRCINAGLPIQIENVIDLANSDGTIRNISTLDGKTLVFVGGGQIKNCRISGKIKVQSGLHQIFDNVYFHYWDVNGTALVYGETLYESKVANTNNDIYNRKTKTLAAANVNTAFNPFETSLTRNKIGEFIAPVLVDGKYVYQENGTTIITFEDDGSGNVKIPIRKDFVFLNNGVVAESTYDIKTKTATYVWAAASTLRISRLYAPARVLIGGIDGSVYPEWWGAAAGSDSVAAFQWAFIHGNDIQLSQDYTISGGVRVFGNTKVSGNKRSVTLSNYSSATSMFEIESLAGVQDGIYITDLTLNGNRSNQTEIQDGIYCDFNKGIQPFNGYSVDNTYWYNLTIKGFSGSGICIAVPGTSHIYSSFLTLNKYDGITWDNEHFTLTNVTCWGNGRHGAYAGGNHWRIIGGAYAHNDAGDNIHCDGAFESQIIGCSCIDSGEFVAETGGGYVASSANPYGYIWVGENQGTHKLVGGNGINLKGCRNMTLIGVRVNNQNANGLLIIDGSNIFVNACQFNQNNMTQGLFKDINSNISSLYIIGTLYDGQYVDSNIKNKIIAFSTSSNNADWNHIPTYLTGFGQGVFTVTDFYGASNRPVGAGTYLQGTIEVVDGAFIATGPTVGRTYIRLSDENGNQYYRYCTINYETGVYSNDTGFIKTYPA